ncbi:hypothetical protein [Escherichia coli]
MIQELSWLSCIPVAAYEPSDGDGGDGHNSSGGNGVNSSGGGNDNSVSGQRIRHLSASAC